MRSVTDNEKWLKEEVEKLYNQYKAVSGDESIKTVGQFARYLKSICSTRNRRWTREEIEKAYEDYVRGIGDIPHTKQLAYAGLPNPTLFKRHMGMTYMEYASKYYPEYLQGERTREKIVEAVNQYIERTGEAPKLKECAKNGLPCQGTFKRIIGMSYAEYTRQHYPDASCKAYPVHKTVWSREKIEETYKAYVEKHGCCPDKRAINSAGLPIYLTFRKIMGMTYTQYARKYYPHLEGDSSKMVWTQEAIEKAYAEYVRKHGACPTTIKIDRKILPHTETFKRVMGMTYGEYARRYYPEFTYRKWPKKKIEKAYSDFVRRNGEHPTGKAWDGKVLPSPATFRRVMGMTYNEYAKTYPIDKDNPALDK